MSTSLPARLRLVLILTLFAYPVVTILLYALAPLTTGWETWQRTLLMVPLMVLIVVFVVQPAVGRLFGRFIAGARAG